MIDAASADLIHRTQRHIGKKDLSGVSAESFIKIMREACSRSGVYSERDLRLAVIIVEELGPVAAVELADNEYPVDVVEVLFERWCELIVDNIDAAYSFIEVGNMLLSEYDRGRLRGMTEIYVVYGPKSATSDEEHEAAVSATLKVIDQMQEREATIRSMGLDPDDPHVA